MKDSLGSVFTSFLKLGFVSFGGYMALISVVHQKFVEQKKKLPDHLLTDMIALSTFLPGPVAVNVVTTVGYYLRGWRGAIAAFTGVLLPAFLFMWVLYELYSRFIQLTLFTSFFHGATSVIVAIIFSVAIIMTKKVFRANRLIAIIPVSFILMFYFPAFWSLLVILLGSGIVGWAINHVKYDSKAHAGYAGWTLPIIICIAAILYFIPRNTIYMDLAGTFSTVSLTLFGGGYVMIPMLNELVVMEKEWLTPNEFIDAIALGQVTPGPILISAAFVGFKQAGFFGGLIATLAIFTPSAVLMVSMYTHLSNWLDNRHVKAFFDGLRLAVIGMIFYSGVVIFLGQSNSIVSAVIGLSSLGLLVFYRISAIYLILGGGIIGVIWQFAGI